MIDDVTPWRAHTVYLEYVALANGANADPSPADAR